MCVCDNCDWTRGNGRLRLPAVLLVACWLYRFTTGRPLPQNENRVVLLFPILFRLSVNSNSECYCFFPSVYNFLQFVNKFLFVSFGAKVLLLLYWIYLPCCDKSRLHDTDVVVAAVVVVLQINQEREIGRELLRRKTIVHPFYTFGSTAWRPSWKTNVFSIQYL